jgi:hypothetical protein
MRSVIRLVVAKRYWTEHQPSECKPRLFALHVNHAFTSATSGSGSLGRSAASKPAPPPRTIRCSASKRARIFQSAVAGDAPRGVASRARSKRQFACSGVPRSKPSCSHFWLCAANGFEEPSPGKQPGSRTADAAAIAMTMVRRTGISGWAPAPSKSLARQSTVIPCRRSARKHPVVCAHCGDPIGQNASPWPTH